MKTVILSSILLLAVTLGVILNIYYTKTTTEQIISLVEKLPVDKDGFLHCSKQVNEITTRWHKHKKVITFLLDYREIETADKAFGELYNCVRGGDFNLYLVSRDTFIHSLNRLVEISVISAENIF